MKKLPKCDLCNKALSMNNHVFIHMVRWDNGKRHEISIQICKDCYEKQGGCFYDEPDNKGS